MAVKGVRLAPRVNSLDEDRRVREPATRASTGPGRADGAGTP